MQEDRIIKLVDYLLINPTDSRAQVELDKVVYLIYEIGEDEIKILEEE